MRTMDGLHVGLPRKGACAGLIREIDPPLKLLLLIYYAETPLLFPRTKFFKRVSNKGVKHPQRLHNAGQFACLASVWIAPLPGTMPGFHGPIRPHSPQIAQPALGLAPHHQWPPKSWTAPLAPTLARIRARCFCISGK